MFLGVSLSSTDTIVHYVQGQLCGGQRVHVKRGGRGARPEPAGYDDRARAVQFDFDRSAHHDLQIV